MVFAEAASEQRHSGRTKRGVENQMEREETQVERTSGSLLVDHLETQLVFPYL